MMNPLENEFPLENINEIIVDNGIVKIIYNDGNKQTVNSNKVRFIKNYKNPNDKPIIDHCE
jgi:hypothetical protein